MRNLMPSYSRIVSVVLIAAMFLTFFYFIWRNTGVASEAKRVGHSRVLTTLSNFNPTFPYVYDAGSLGLNVTDKSEADWAKVHARAVEREELPAKQSEDSRSWLVDNFTVKKPYGTVVTPFLVNKTLSTRDPEIESKSTDELDRLFGLRLWFAHDDSEGKLFVLGRLAPMDGADLDFLSLRLSSNKPEEMNFIVSFDDNGDLYFRDGTTFDDEKNPVIEDGASGAWWPSGQNRFFELALENVQPDNVDLSITIERESEKDGLTTYAIGTHRLPLLETGFSYETFLDLFLHSFYAVHDRKHWLAIWGGGEYGREGTAGIRLTRLLSPVYQLYFYFQEIEPCPEPDLNQANEHWEGGTCYLSRRGEYRLRILERFTKDRDDGRVGVLIEEPLRPPLGSILPFLLIIPLGLVTYYFNGRLRETNKELNDAGEKLEQSNVDLAKVNTDLDDANKRLASFVSNFRHQGKNLLEELLALAGEDGSGEIKEKAGQIKAILQEAVDIHAYERLVSDSIKADNDTFSLSWAVDKKLDSHRQRAKNIDFHDNTQRQGFRLFLSAARGQSNNPSHYFDQVIEAIVDNAVQRRNPKTSMITVSLDAKPVDKPSCAIFKVSNFGPVPDLTGIKAEDLFKYTYRRPPDPEKSLISTPRRDKSNHGGLGLYIVSQIVKAYEGTCKLEILEGNKGVEVTVELPVEPKPKGAKNSGEIADSCG